MRKTKGEEKTYTPQSAPFTIPTADTQKNNKTTVDFPTMNLDRISDPDFQQSKDFLPLLSHLLDLYNGIAENHHPDQTLLPQLLRILKANRPLFLPYLDTTEIEQKLKAAI